MSLLSCLRLPVAVAALASTCWLAPATASESVRLNFGVYSANKPSAMVKIFRPVLRELESNMSTRLGKRVDIRMQIAKEYDDGITNLTNGKFDFSRFGPSSYVEAKRMNQDLRILAAENVGNAKVFYGIIAVKGDSPIQDISELRGESFAFGDEGSTIGRFLSQLYLEQNGIRASDLSDYQYLGRHDKVGTAVGAGDFAAGALNERTFKKLVASGENIRELARFPNVTKPWIARSGLDPEVYEALREGLLQINNPDALKGLKIDGFLSGDDEDYQVIRTAMENNYVFFTEPEQNNTDGNASLAAAMTLPEVLEVPAGVAHTAGTVAGNAQQSGNSLTITINLPRSVLADATTGSGDGFRHITINVAVPDDTASPNVSVKAADAGEL